jgi:hypothetical protein
LENPAGGRFILVYDFRYPVHFNYLRLDPVAYQNYNPNNRFGANKMNSPTTILAAYAIFIWLVVLHTFEEIASGIFDLEIGSHKPGKNRYLLVASGISTLNMVTLVLLILSTLAGNIIGLFTTAIFGILQGLVHTVGYFREGRKARGLGAGFYSAIPLTIVGAITFYLLLRSMF